MRDPIDTPKAEILRLPIVGTTPDAESYALNYLANASVVIYGGVMVSDDGDSTIWYDVELDGHELGSNFATITAAISFGLWLLIDPDDATSSTDGEPF